VPAWLSRLDADRRRRIAHLALAVVLSAPALWHLWLILRLFAARVGYAFDIEWLESSALYEAYRISQLQGTYGPPSQGFLPLFHPPGYLVVLAVVGRIAGGVDYGVGRGLAFAFFLAWGLITLSVLRRHYQNRVDGTVAGLLSIGVAGAAVPMTAGFYDLVRSDTMAWALCTLAAALALPKRPKPARIALLAVLMTAALYTRLLTVFMIVWIHLFVFARHRKSGLMLALSTSSICGLVLVGLQFNSQGWFWIYIAGSLQKHGIRLPRLAEGMTLLFQYAPFAAALPVVGLVLAFARKLSPASIMWLGLLAASLPAALLPFAKLGGYGNDFMPFALMVAPAALLLAADAAQALGKYRAWSGAALRYLAFAAIGAFLVVRDYDPMKLAPDERRRDRAAALNERIARLEGGVISPRHPFLPIENGHRTRQFNNMTYLDAMWGGIPGLRLGNYLDRIQARWALVMGTESPNITPDLAPRYYLWGTIPTPPTTVIGEHSTVTHLLHWRDPRIEHVVFDFEDETFDGWRVTGAAFEDWTSRERRPGQGNIVGLVGQHLANSFHPTLRDRAVGTLTSPPFVIDMSMLGARIGGGRNVRIELLVGQRAVQRASPLFFNQETLLEVVWDVTSYIGEEAQIRLVDANSGDWGHLVCDQVVLFEPTQP